ncbi:hypothetical protein ABG768_017264 [Culter alburnus]|uniref:Uncharacterized protein n=1 Tax=Culter alburnus TaxID=194366 RepID=A0AAW1YVU7_CULAL
MIYENYISQNGRLLEEYVEVYLQLYHEARWDDETLKQHFWSGMDDILVQMLLLKEDHLPFIEFVDYALPVCGSSLIAGVVENNDTIISDSPGQSTPPAAISLPAPEKTLRPSLECPDTTERPPAAIPVMTPMPATESEPESVPRA